MQMAGFPFFLKKRSRPYYNIDGKTMCRAILPKIIQNKNNAKVFFSAHTSKLNLCILNLEHKYLVFYK